MSIAHSWILSVSICAVARVEYLISVKYPTGKRNTSNKSKETILTYADLDKKK